MCTEPFKSAGHGLDRLVAIAGDAYHDRLVARNPPLFYKLLAYCERGSSGGFRKDSFGFGQ